MKIEEVKAVWEEHLPKLEESFVGFPWENETAYAWYLSQTYRYITHSCQLLRYAAERTEVEGLKHCLEHHDEEEDGHEKMALKDLERLGYSLNQLPELPITQQIYQTIYTQIDQFGPAAIIGYALALEGVSARRCPEIAQRLVARYGALKSTLIKVHGDLDPSHIESSFDVLQYFNEEELSRVAQVIQETVYRYREYLLTLSKQPHPQVEVSA